MNAGTIQTVVAASEAINSVSAASLMIPEAVKEPLHRRAGAEDRGLQRVGKRIVGRAGDGGRAAPGSADRLVAGVQEDEAAGAIGVIRRPGAKQVWPNRAACWSPAFPATGTSPPNSVVVAYR